MSILGKRPQGPATQQEGWRYAAEVTYTPEQDRQANSNFARMVEERPEDGARLMRKFAQTGLGDHPSVVEHFSRGTWPLTDMELGIMLAYPTANGVPHDKGILSEEPASSSQADRIYRKPR